MTARRVTRRQGPPGDRAVTSRFAPSPTGQLHLGHAFSAVQAHDLARAAGGRFLLRIEDIDGTRSRPAHVAGVADDLRWLGLDWDGEPLLQSTRLPAHADAVAALAARGLAYRCTCTRADIAAAGSAPHGPAGAIYPGTCRGRDVAPGAPFAWRLNMARAVAAAPGPLLFHDSRAGGVEANPLPHGDVVLSRKDVASAYHLAVVLDDAWSGVTDVVRGADLLPATHVHRLLQALLGLPTPRYHHHPLLHGPDGRRLAKRDGAPPLAALRGRGADPAAIVARLRALAAGGDTPMLGP